MYLKEIQYDIHISNESRYKVIENIRDYFEEKLLNKIKSKRCKTKHCTIAKKN